MKRLPFLALAVAAAVLVSGCSREGRPPASSPQAGENPFTSGSPEVTACLKQTLGKEAFEAFVNRQDRPTQAEEELVGQCFRQFGGGPMGSPGQTGPQPSPVSSLPSCNSTEVFTASPFAFSDLDHIIPLGNLNPKGGHVLPTQHVYLILKRATSQPSQSGSYAVEVPAVSPGKIKIRAIGSFEYLSANPPYTDWTVDFAPCKEVSAYFHHIATLTEKIQGKFTEPLDCNDYATGSTGIKLCRKVVDIEVQAGEVIGTARGLDLGASDTRAPNLAYANPSRYRAEQLKIVCPIDYFESGVKSQLMERLGERYGDGKMYNRTVQPVCGEVNQDRAGTAQGNWFAKGTPSPVQLEDRHLALVHGNVDPTKAVFSVGTSANASGLYADWYYFTPKSSGLVNRDFKDITADGNVYCFEPEYKSPSITILLQMTSPTTLRIEGQSASSCGSGPWQLGSALTDFER